MEPVKLTWPPGPWVPADEPGLVVMAATAAPETNAVMTHAIMRNCAFILILLLTYIYADSGRKNYNFATICHEPLHVM